MASPVFGSRRAYVQGMACRGSRNSKYIFSRFSRFQSPNICYSNPIEVASPPDGRRDQGRQFEAIQLRNFRWSSVSLVHVLLENCHINAIGNARTIEQQKWACADTVLDGRTELGWRRFVHGGIVRGLRTGICDGWDFILGDGCDQNGDELAKNDRGNLRENYAFPILIQISSFLH